MARDDNTCSKGTISHIDLTNWPNKITKLGHSLYVQAISVLGGITYLLYNGQLRGPFNGSWNEIFKKHPIPFYYCVGILTPFDLLSNCHSVVKTLLIVHSMCNVMAIWICIYLHCNAWSEGHHVLITSWSGSHIWDRIVVDLHMFQNSPAKEQAYTNQRGILRQSNWHLPPTQSLPLSCVVLWVQPTTVTLYTLVNIARKSTSLVSKNLTQGNWVGAGLLTNVGFTFIFILRHRMPISRSKILK
jgi:hypothetical protein